jgi:glutamine phosphoribosylpyrophosphate amidotransferase
MPTKGSPILNTNNHPIIAGRVIGVHNGIINNDDALFSKYANRIERAGQVDSEIIFRLIDYHIFTGKTIVESVKLTSRDLIGSYAVAFIHTDWPRYLTIFSNAMTYSNAVLYVFKNTRSMVFASSKYILNEALSGLSWLPVSHSIPIEISMAGIRIDLDSGKIFGFDLDKIKCSRYTPVRR